MMMRYCGTLALAAAIGLVGTTRSSAAETLQLDTKQSKIEFVGKKSDGQHSGGFKKFDGKTVADFENPQASTLELVIDATSLWSDNEKLTNHLKNPDFFDVRKHPKITFTATKLEPTGEGKGKITGNLTMLGKTAPITIPVEADVEDTQITVKSSFKLDRTKWGMDYGKGNIEDDVAVTAELVFAR